MKLTHIVAASLLFATSGAFAADKVCKLEIAGTDAMQFDKKELAVAGDCTQVELTLKHSGKLPAQAMGHNWVLTKTSDVASPIEVRMRLSLSGSIDMGRYSLSHL